MTQQRIALCGGSRTAIGKFGGSLAELGALDLGAEVVKGCLKRAGAEAVDIERLVLGENIQVTRGGNPARHVLLRSGIPVEADDYSINMNCSSGLRAITCLSQDLLRNDVKVGVAAGTESMSNTPYMLEKARRGYRLGNGVLVDFLADYILGDAGPMAEKVAATYNISREDQDRWALDSQQKALDAIDAGVFADSIVPINIAKKGAEASLFTVDEHPRRGLSLESLAKLKPVFDPAGTVTVGNSSGINDGAAAFVVCTEETAHEHGYVIDGFLTGWASAGVEPGLFGIGPVPAVRKLLGTRRARRGRYRPCRAERGLRLLDSRRCPRAQVGRGQGERQRRSHRARPPGRGHRDHPHYQVAQRAQKAPAEAWHRHHVRRQRPGHGAVGRNGLDIRPGSRQSSECRSPGLGQPQRRSGARAPAAATQSRTAWNTGTPTASTAADIFAVYGPPMAPQTTGLPRPLSLAMASTIFSSKGEFWNTNQGITTSTSDSAMSASMPIS